MAEQYDVIMDENLAKGEYPNFNEGHKSFMRKYLTPEVWAKLKDVKTASGWTIMRAVNSGCVNPDSLVGCHAGDIESYSVFGDLFDPVIEEYHRGYSKDKKHVTDMDPAKLQGDINQKEAIVSTRIRVARNLFGFPLNPSSTKEQRLEIEVMMQKVFDTLEGDLAGTYYSLATTSDEQKKELVADHFLFKPGDRFQAASGYHSYWPAGRGIFHNKDKTFLLWINEGDHIRIISMEKGGDVKGVFSRLSRGVAAIEAGIKKITGNPEAFLHTEHHGMITCCPSNLGTGLRGSVHIRIPNLLKKKSLKELDAFVRSQFGCQARGTMGEHTEVTDTVDISNFQRIGRPEYDLVQDMINAANELTKLENE